MKKHELKTRDQKIKYVFAMDAECDALLKNIARSKINLILLKGDADRLVEEIKMDDLVIFCQTGKYPE